MIIQMLNEKLHVQFYSVKFYYNYFVLCVISRRIKSQSHVPISFAFCSWPGSCVRDKSRAVLGDSDLHRSGSRCP